MQIWGCATFLCWYHCKVNIFGCTLIGQTKHLVLTHVQSNGFLISCINFLSGSLSLSLSIGVTVLWAIDADGYHLTLYFYCTLNFSLTTRELLLLRTPEQYSEISAKSGRGNSCPVLPEKMELWMWTRGGGWTPWGQIYPGHCCSGLCSCYHC